MPNPKENKPYDLEKLKDVVNNFSKQKNIYKKEGFLSEINSFDSQIEMLSKQIDKLTMRVEELESINKPSLIIKLSKIEVKKILIKIKGEL